MKVLISIDDTDDIESRGTGEIADLLAAGITEHGWGSCGQVTRHQLLLSPEIPYTSHNSSMCFPAEISDRALERVTAFCCTELRTQSVPSSDPGLCIVRLERLLSPNLLVDFGREAKKRVIATAEAYALASLLGVHLSEHGGTVQGVIGALAGAGLRLSGDDGRFKGKLQVPSSGGSASVAEIRRAGIDLVQTVQGERLDDEERVLVGDWVKPVLMGGRAVLLAVPAANGGDIDWMACERKLFKNY